MLDVISDNKSDKQGLWNEIILVLNTIWVGQPNALRTEMAAQWTWPPELPPAEQS